MTEMHENSQTAPSQQVTAASGGEIRDVIQAVVSGQVTGDVHIGDKIYNRSEIEEMWDYLSRAIAKYSSRMLREVLRVQHTLPQTPYRSLDHFDLAHSSVFFGREQAVSQFLGQLRSKNRLTILHAPSGAGKTSFIRAGLEPALWSRGDLVLYARSFSDPILALKQVVVSVGRPGSSLADLSLHEFFQWLALSLESDQHLFVFLDQFEEFFIHLPQSTKDRFIDDLVQCLEDETLSAYFVLSLRKDYLAELEAFKERIPAIFHNTFSLPPLERDQAVEAIVQPADLFGVTWTTEVVSAILDYLAKEDIAPPHLQLICTRLYEHATETGSQRITNCHLDELNGLTAIHRDYLVNELRSLRGPQGLIEKEEVGWRLLKTLVTAQGTAAPRTPDYLRENLDADSTVLDEVLERLVRQRILRKDSTPNGDVVIEIAHNTLASEIQSRQSPQEILTKAALELIERELLNHRLHPSILMYEEHLRILDEYKNDLPILGTEAAGFIFQSAAFFNHEVEFWINHVKQAFASNRTNLARLFKTIMRDITQKLHFLEIQVAYGGGEKLFTRLSVVNEIVETREVIELLRQELSNLDIDTEEDGYGMNASPGFKWVDRVQNHPDEVLTRRWLGLQERRARFTVTEMPVRLQMQILRLEEEVAQLAAYAECSEQRVLGKKGKLAEEWLESLNRQYFSLLRSHHLLTERVALHGFAFIPTDLMQDVRNIQERLCDNILERWNDFPDFQSKCICDSEVNVIRELISTEEGDRGDNLEILLERLNSDAIT